MPFEETSRRPRGLRRTSLIDWERLYGLVVAFGATVRFRTVPSMGGRFSACRHSVKTL